MRIPEEMTALLAAERLPHACALVGTDRAVLTELAETLAMALVCEGETKPCEKCGGCIRALAGTHPDIIRPDSSTLKTKSVSVDAVRTLRQEAYVKPSEAARKVFLLTEPMTPQAQNALLKILEEPPPAVCFLLVCDTPEAFLKTVQSRVTFFYPNAETVTDDTDGETEEKAQEFLRLSLSTAEIDLLIFTAALKADRESIGLFLDAMLMLLRRGLTGISPEQFRRLGTEQILSLMDLTIETKSVLANAHIALLLARYCSEFRRLCGY